ncbi:hypothetical protein DUI87_15642 [Hirundo rustica rustica]|uniref:Uncharacterized protein n=1 Tax=Hirundo rustica rustica TaxID=333673 RepID=A0A3M0JYW8_HIRRU|nr:hypothetical protein DUI87_15642 [Hirundo rustica rustica]
MSEVIAAGLMPLWSRVGEAELFLVREAVTVLEPRIRFTLTLQISKDCLEQNQVAKYVRGILSTAVHLQIENYTKIHFNPAKQRPHSKCSVSMPWSPLRLLKEGDRSSEAQLGDEKDPKGWRQNSVQDSRKGQKNCLLVSQSTAANNTTKCFIEPWLSKHFPSAACHEAPQLPHKMKTSPTLTPPVSTALDEDPESTERRDPGQLMLANKKGEACERNGEGEEGENLEIQHQEVFMREEKRREEKRREEKRREEKRREEKRREEKRREEKRREEKRREEKLNQNNIFKYRFLLLSFKHLTDATK